MGKKMSQLFKFYIDIKDNFHVQITQSINHCQKMGLAYDEGKPVNIWKWLTLILPLEKNRYNNVFFSFK